MRVLAIANRAGGVGKSTLAVHLAYAALEAGLRVLLVDMDKQGSLSLTFTEPSGAEPGLRPLLCTVRPCPRGATLRRFLRLHHSC